MNPQIRINIFKVKTALSALLLTTSLAQAATVNRTWLGGTDGNWGTAANWSPSGAPVTGAPYDSVLFTNSANLNTTNNIAASLSVSNLTVASGGVTINGSSLIVRRGITNQAGVNIINVPVTLANNPKNWDVAPGSEIVIAGATDTSTFTGNAPFEKFNGGNVRFKAANVWAQGADIFGGAAIIDGGALSVTNDGFRLSATSGGWAGLIITNNGTFTNGNFKGNFNLRLGDTAGLSGTNELNISSGQIVLGKSIQQLVVGGAAGTFGVLNQSGGSILFQNNTNTPSGVLIGNNASASGIYNLNGGLLSTPVVSGGSGISYFNFNGGTLRASSPTNAAAFFQGLTGAFIKNGGATIDTAGYDLTIAQALQNGGSGGLTKIGNGTLTLSGANSYVGATLISTGKLILPSAQSGGGSVQVADNTALGVKLSSAGSTLNVSALTLGTMTGATNEYILGAFGNPTAPVINATNLTVNGTIIVNLSGAGLSVGQCTLIKYSALSGVGSFALSALPIGVAAYVSNNIANSSVDLVITSAPTLVWTGTAGSAWDIGTTVNWFDPVAVTSAVYSEGTAVRFDDSASSSTVNLAASVSPGGVTFTNNTVNFSVTGSAGIIGSGGLTKSGSGAVTLATPNSYAGNTLVKNGTLRLGASDVIPNGTNKGDIAVDGQLDLNGFNDTVNGLTGSGVVNVSAGSSTLTIGDNNSSSVFSGSLANSGGTLAVTKTGSGALTLNGNNTLSGGVNVTAGQLLLGSSGALGTGGLTLTVPVGNVTLASYGGAVIVTNPITIAGLVNSARTANFDSSAGDLILNNSLTSSGQYLNKFGPNAVRLNSATASALGGGYLNLYQGDFILDGATWANTEGATRFFASGTDTVRFVITNGASYTIGTGNTQTPNFRLGFNDGLTGTNVVDISSGSINLDISAVQIYVGDGVNTRGVFNQSGGTVSFVNTTNTSAGVLLGASTNSIGWYHLDGGTLLTPRVIGGSGSGYFYFNGGTLIPTTARNATNFVGGFTAAFVQNGGAIIDTAGYDLTVNQALLGAGTGGFTKLGAGTLTLTGSNTYFGATLVNVGKLWLPTVHAGGGSITVADNTGFGALVSASGTTLNTSALTLGIASGATNDFDFGTLLGSVTPVIRATNLTVNGTIVVNISGSSLTQGQIALIKYDSATGLTGGSFQLASLPPNTTGYLSNNVANSSVDLVVTTPPTLVWRGTTDGNWDIATTFNWFDKVTLASAVYVEGASVRFDDSATGSTSVSLASAVAPSITVISNVVKNYSITGASGIGGIGGLVKDGAGTAILGTPNTYASNTVINAGLLQLGASEVIPDGAGKGTVTLNGKLDLAGNSETINGLSGTGVVDNSSGTGTLNVGANNATNLFSGTLTNSGGALSLNKIGGGTLTLTGNSSFSGGATLSGGRLEIGSSNALGNGAISLAPPVAGVTLATYNANLTLTNAVSISGSSGNVATVDTTGGNLTLAGVVNSSAPDLNKNGTNALRFTSPTPSVLNGGKIVINQGDLIFDGTAWTNYGGAIRVIAPSSEISRVVVTNNATLSLGAGGNTPNLRLGYVGGFTGTNIFDISSGLLLLDESFVQILVGDAANTYGIFNQTGGTVLFQNNVSTSAGVLLGSSSGSVSSYYLNGGVLVTPRVIGGSGTGNFYFNGGVLKPSSATTAAANFFKSLTGAFVQDGGAIIDTTNVDITISQRLQSGGNGGLLKLGSAALTLTGSNSYAGPTVISNGTLVVNGSIGTNSVTVAGGLAGTGVIKGAVTVTTNGTLVLGSVDVVNTGITSYSNNVLIVGNLFAKLNKSLAQSNDFAVVAGSLVNTGSGTLTLSNVGPALVVGDSFKLFSQPLVNGNSLTILPAPDAGLAWQNNLAVDGSVKLVTATSYATNPTNISATVSGPNLTLAWPADHTGWKLQVQTNAPGAGLGTNWFDVPGATLTNQFTLPINPANASVFFRLALP